MSTTNPFALQVTEVEPDMIPNLKSQAFFISHFTAQKNSERADRDGRQTNPFNFPRRGKIGADQPLIANFGLMIRAI